VARARALVCASTDKALPIAMSDEDQSKPAPALARKVMAAIGQELRRIYAEIIAEGVPKRFAEILRRLDESTGERETP
jgi:Anti-sigma factor NepR